MRLVSSVRLRTVGLLLLEAVGFGLLRMERINKDPALQGSLLSFVNKVRKL